MSQTSSNNSAKTPEEIQQEMIEMLMQSQMEHLIAPVDYAAITKPIASVTAGNGMFRVRKTPVAAFISCTEEFSPEEQHHDIPFMEPGVILLVDKIPYKYLIQSLTFYRDVYEKDMTEAATLMFWNHKDIVLPTHYPDAPLEEIPGLVVDGKLIIYCPKQLNDGALTSFRHDSFVDWLRKNTTPFVELHSHHRMGAFWSSTDNANENATQFYFVWGEIFNEQPDFRFRYVNGKEHKIDISPAIVFDCPVTIHTDDSHTMITIDPYVPEDSTLVDSSEEAAVPSFPRVEYPKSWIEQQHTPNRMFSAFDYELFGTEEAEEQEVSEVTLLGGSSISKTKAGVIMQSFFSKKHSRNEDE